MTRYIMAFAALLIGAPAFAQDPLAPIAPEPDGLEVASPVAVQEVQECAGEKFVFAWGAGARPTRVTLCSEKGATTADVIRMIEDAVDKIDASSIPEDRRIAIAQQMRGKVAELKGKSVAEAPAQAGPPLSPAPISPPSIARAAPLATTAPAPLSVALATPAAGLSKPRLQFRCYTPGQIGSGGPCTTIGRETRLTVRAEEAVPAGTSLRFARSGRDRAELDLGAMRKGQSRTLVLPREMCSGVVEAEAEIRVARSGQVLDTLGPYLLRC